MCWGKKKELIPALYYKSSRSTPNKHSIQRTLIHTIKVAIIYTALSKQRIIRLDTKLFYKWVRSFYLSLKHSPLSPSYWLVFIHRSVMLPVFIQSARYYSSKLVFPALFIKAHVYCRKRRKHRKQKRWKLPTFPPSLKNFTYWLILSIFLLKIP